ncbi:uncharacterized protein LOC124668162 isoform X2 [Lolium rigidum]|uniref:uncharacterized protein LOC124668162 isoform X2 n=1 Tax=Lolium rigidum TaxID=89674 RepID=UPI001F5D76F5|nr:uncharacterized protein LOC124668162 isoform X2 [Lolium rigidum]
MRIYMWRFSIAPQHSMITSTSFFDVVPILASRFLRPRHIDGPHSKIANDDRFFPYFENCLGAIDGSHVPVTRSPQLQAPWRNRKGSLSQNVMFACDFDLNVTFISCGWEGSIAEGNFNFTSTSTTSREDLTQVISDDDEPEGDTEADIAERESEDEHEVMDPAPSAQSMTQVEHQVKGKRVAAARNKLAKIPKRSSKKRNSDGIVQVMERMVQVREKEVTQEQPLQKFSITRCMDALKTLDGMTGSIKIPALDVFKIADNREIFLNLVDDKDDKDGTAMTWLLAQIAKLP